MIPDPKPADDPEGTAQPAEPSPAPETEQIEDEGEPLGANFA